ncbi:uncharacterized protein LOC142768376 [Rhipicephalus microplus]|uniref:uncharacterized protein LOC142768376 n=1 Tax=Rhipicephalus microplus TaxID=6941 RepID=UPI003F6D15E6
MSRGPVVVSAGGWHPNDDKGPDDWTRNSARAGNRPTDTTYQPEYNPNASAYPTADDPYGTPYRPPYDPAYQPSKSSSLMLCCMISIFCVVFVFICVAMIFTLTTADVIEVTDTDYGGSSGGSVGGGGSSGASPMPPSQPPVVQPGGQPSTDLTTRELSTAATSQQTLSTEAPAPPPAIATVAEPMPSYSYVCTVSQPVRENVSYLPSDGMCDYIFYDSLYKDGNNRLLGGIGALEPGTQFFIDQAPKYRRSHFGVSFAPE